MSKTRFWVSWWQQGEDYRPITFPPPDGILGWWCSGTADNDMHTLCAVIEAYNEEDVRQIIRNAGAWPDAGEERFCEAKSIDFRPNDRFPINDWMIERFDKKHETTN